MAPCGPQGNQAAMRVTSLGSGSSGNALLIEAGPQCRTKLLVDAGFTGKVLIERLKQAGVSPGQLQGVLITHEHTDHILGLPSLMKQYGIQMMSDPRTLGAIDEIFSSGVLRTESGSLVSLEANHLSLNSLPVGSRCGIGDIEVLSFPVSHDAVAPCGYLLSAGGCRVCVAIDSGEVTATMLEAMNDADLLILESNHDRERLLRGPYPYSLKQRILSSTGHLSNDQAAEAVLRVWRGDGVRWLWLSHLSRTNNTPQLALQCVVSRISRAKANLSQLHVTVLPPGMGGVWDSTQLWRMSSLWTF